MKKRLLLAFAACGLLVAMGSIIVGAVTVVQAVGRDLPAIQLPTMAFVKGMPITTQTDCRRLLGDPDKTEIHREYPPPQAVVAEHWDYFQACTEQNCLIDIVVWWSPDGALQKVAFRNSETGEVLR